MRGCTWPRSQPFPSPKSCRSSRRLWMPAAAPCWSPRPAPARRRWCRWPCSTRLGWAAAGSYCSSRAGLPPAPLPAACPSCSARSPARLSAMPCAWKAACRRRRRIMVVTEGVLARMILDDPELPGCLGRTVRRVPRALARRRFRAGAGARRAERAAARSAGSLVMSATLDGARVAKLLDGARR